MDIGTKDNPIDISNFKDKDFKEKFNSSKKFWVSFNCKKCHNLTKKIINKRLYKTNKNKYKFCQKCLTKMYYQKNYGVDYGFQSIEIKDKIKDTCLEKYGVDNPSKSKQVINKIKETFNSKYGVDNVFQLDSIKEKSKETKKILYDNENFNNRDKAFKTNLEKYGEENPYAIGSNKFAEILKEKYGVENPSQLPNHYEKSKETIINRYGGYDYIINKGLETKMNRYGSLCLNKRYLYNNLTFDSSWELIFYVYYNDKGRKIEREPTYFEYYDKDGNKHSYFPDFKIGRKYFEIKGNQFLIKYKNGNIKTLINPYNKVIENEKWKCIKSNGINLITEKKRNETIF